MKKYIVKIDYFNSFGIIKDHVIEKLGDHYVDNTDCRRLVVNSYMIDDLTSNHPEWFYPKIKEDEKICTHISDIKNTFGEKIGKACDEAIDKILKENKKDWEVHFAYHNGDGGKTFYKTYFYNLTQEEINSFLEGNEDLLSCKPIKRYKSVHIKSEQDEEINYKEIFNESEFFKNKADLYLKMILDEIKKLIKTPKEFTKQDMIDFRACFVSNSVETMEDVFNEWLNKRNQK